MFDRREKLWVAGKIEYRDLENEEINTNTTSKIKPKGHQEKSPEKMVMWLFNKFLSTFLVHSYSFPRLSSKFPFFDVKLN